VWDAGSLHLPTVRELGFDYDIQHNGTFFIKPRKKEIWVEWNKSPSIEKGKKLTSWFEKEFAGWSLFDILLQERIL